MDRLFYFMGKRMLMCRRDTGAIGIGSLIIFISMVLIAGIAASILIQTSTTLEMQSLNTGFQTTESVASGILIQAIEGYNSSGAIVRMAIEIKLKAGSPPIDLSTTVIEISDPNTKYVLEYDLNNFTLSEDIGGNIFNQNFYPSASKTTKYGIIVLYDSDGSVTSTSPIINSGDHVILALDDVFGGIKPLTRVNGQVIPEIGSPAIILFTSPQTYTDAIMELQ
ncbi:MAG: flagellin [Thermoplasmatota archaeon]